MQEAKFDRPHGLRYTILLSRGVAQLGSARRSGRRSRRFKSSLPDQTGAATPCCSGFCLLMGRSTPDPPSRTTQHQHVGSYNTRYVVRLSQYWAYTVPYRDSNPTGRPAPVATDERHCPVVRGLCSPAALRATNFSLIQQIHYPVRPLQ